jgi:hypothetical protein
MEAAKKASLSTGESPEKGSFNVSHPKPAETKGGFYFVHISRFLLDVYNVIGSYWV